MVPAAKTYDALVNHWVENARKDIDLSGVNVIGIDETSIKKVHNYVSVIADMSSRKVIDVQVGKDGKLICKFAGQLEVNGGIEVK